MTEINRLPRSTPEEQGISSAGILNFIDAFEQEAASRSDMEIHSMMLLRHGKVVAEGWWAPNAPHYRHMLYSLSKSFTSTAVGFTVGEGLLTVDDPVVSFFPEDLPEQIGEHLAAMKVRHLLSMNTGHAIDTTETMVRSSGGNWAKAFLGIPVEHMPGTHFLYNTGATYMLSAIVQKLTGSRIIDYLKPRLFDPLGIADPVWEECPRGINTGGYGLSVRTEDIAKFGQLYLQKGVWQGKQLIAKEWVEEATRKHSENGSGLETASDWEQGYGYQFWRCRHGAYRGDGAFGQYCIVMQEQDAVLAVTSAVADMSRIYDLSWKHLLPAMASDPLNEDTEAYAALKKRLEGAQLPMPRGNMDSGTAKLVSGKKVVLDKNILEMDSMTFLFDQGDCTLISSRKDEEYRLACGLGKWAEGTAAQTGVPSLYKNTDMIHVSGVWTEENTFTVWMRFSETPHYLILTYHFNGEQFTMEAGINLTMDPFEVPRITGKIRE